MIGHDHKIFVIKEILRKIDGKSSDKNNILVIYSNHPQFGNFRSIVREKLFFSKYSGEILK
jgi:hypothetical protein